MYQSEIPEAPKKYQNLFGEIRAETAKAILLRIFYEDGTTKDEWFPISQMKSIHRNVIDDEDEDEFIDVLVISDWIASQKDI